MKIFLFTILMACSLFGHAGIKPFRFAFISDTHIGSPNGNAEEDLRRTVRDINAMDDIAFVVLTGDITELGTNEELLLAKKILDSLDVPWYIIPGNHDTGWSESGGLMFSSVFGDDKFSFEYGGIRFLGCASGPYVRMSDGHVPRNAVNWLDAELRKLKPNQPLIFLNHYPIDNGLDNWYEVTDRLRNKNIRGVLCGHGHANRKMDFEGISGVMGRSNLRAKDQTGGYNVVDVTDSLISFSVRIPGIETKNSWTTLSSQVRKNQKQPFTRPDYSMNTTYPFIKEKWSYAAPANVISTPAVTASAAFVGDQNGTMRSFDIRTGKIIWEFQTGGPIFSSPAVTGNNILFGSADGYIYSIDAGTGKLIWKTKTRFAVLGSPLVNQNIVYIGGSDGTFRALSVSTGDVIWQFEDIDGPVVSTPLLYNGKVIFGAWDRNVYALSADSGKLQWKWNNGSTVRNYSPASCIPVAAGNVVYVVAPDRYISAIDFHDGKTLWRNNDATVRESIGISEDRSTIYGKTMQDTIVAYTASSTKQKAKWKMHAGFGYEHVPSMLIEKNGKVYFGTKNGVVYCIDPVTQKVVWSHKLDNSMVNTVRVLNNEEIIVSTMDGKISLLNISN